VEEDGCGVAGLKGSGIGFWHGGRSTGIDVAMEGEAEASSGALETQASSDPLKNGRRIK
jgi:hypothetical protein